MLKNITLTIFTISLLGCANAEIPIVSHPELITPIAPELPKFSRKMINCGFDKETGELRDASVLDLCIRIKQREIILEDHILILEELIDLHNDILGAEPESGSN
jgi:hypothetical protein